MKEKLKTGRGQTWTNVFILAVIFIMVSGCSDNATKENDIALKLRAMSRDLVFTDDRKKLASLIVVENKQGYTTECSFLENEPRIIDEIAILTKSITYEYCTALYQSRIRDKCAQIVKSIKRMISVGNHMPSNMTTDGEYLESGLCNGIEKEIVGFKDTLEHLPRGGLKLESNRDKKILNPQHIVYAKTQKLVPGPFRIRIKTVDGTWHFLHFDSEIEFGRSWEILEKLRYEFDKDKRV
ncbi:MAG: hypothetical protein JKX76_03760 [Colwellia sp.]|nr:hypothetical protein [Colwellia sp.]